jgi:hypothetical protein
MGGLTLGAAQYLGALIGEGHTAQNAGKPRRGRFDRDAALGGEVLAVVAQRPLQHRPLVGDLGGDDPAYDVVGLLGGAVLRAPQEHVAADRALDPRLEPALPVEQHQRDAAAGERAHQRR